MVVETCDNFGFPEAQFRVWAWLCSYNGKEIKIDWSRCPGPFALLE